MYARHERVEESVAGLPTGRGAPATLSYAHRLLNLLLRASGEANHVSRDFAQYHVFASDGDE